VTLPTASRQLDRVLFQLSLDTGGTVKATVDDAHFYVVAKDEASPGVDLIDDNGFETSDAGFGPFGPLDGTVTRTTTDPIAGGASLHIALNAFGRAGLVHNYGFGSGPFADSVTVSAKVRVETADTTARRLQVCSIAYLLNDQVPLTACESFAVDPTAIQDVDVSLPTQGRQLDRVLFQFSLNDNGTLAATIDDAHAVVVPTS
jgi:hypothetical protein